MHSSHPMAVRLNPLSMTHIPFTLLSLRMHLPSSLLQGLSFSRLTAILYPSPAPVAACLCLVAMPGAWAVCLAGLRRLVLAVLDVLLGGHEAVGRELVPRLDATEDLVHRHEVHALHLRLGHHHRETSYTTNRLRK